MKLNPLTFQAATLCLILSFAFESTAQTTNPSPHWICGQQPSESKDVTVAEWSASYLQSAPGDLPLFLYEWLNESVDADQDQKVSVAEQQQILCRMAGALKLETGRQSSLVLPDGRVDWLGFWAGDAKVSAEEFRFGLSLVAEAWNKKLIAGTLFSLTSFEQIVQFLAEGSFGVSESQIEMQQDLLGRDHSRTGQLQKQLAMAYILSELKSKAKEHWPELASLYFELAMKLKNVPWIQSVNPTKNELTLAVNTVTRTEIGVRGSYRYYVLHAMPVRLRAGEKPVWSQPSGQSTFLLSEKETYGPTDLFVRPLQRKLLRLCERSGSVFQILQGQDSILRSGHAGLQQKFQSVVDELADAFLTDAPQVILTDGPLQGGSTAYLDAKTGELSISWDLLSALAAEVSTQDLNRHLVFLILQEFIHSLQVQADVYEMNFRLYNSPQWAYSMFGDVGYRDYYLAQPVERDAQRLAALFVEGLENSCKSLKPQEP